MPAGTIYLSSWVCEATYWEWAFAAALKAVARVHTSAAILGYVQKLHFNQWNHSSTGWTAQATRLYRASTKWRMGDVVGISAMSDKAEFTFDGTIYTLFHLISCRGALQYPSMHHSYLPPLQQDTLWPAFMCRCQPHHPELVGKVTHSNQDHPHPLHHHHSWNHPNPPPHGHSPAHSYGAWSLMTQCSTSQTLLFQSLPSILFTWILPEGLVWAGGGGELYP